MANDPRTTPHPLKIQPTLYAVDIPIHLKWPQLVVLLQRCGEVRSGGRSMTPDGRRRWAITFSDIYQGMSSLLEHPLA